MGRNEPQPRGPRAPRRESHHKVCGRRTLLLHQLPTARLVALWALAYSRVA